MESIISIITFWLTSDFGIAMESGNIGTQLSEDKTLKACEIAESGGPPGRVIYGNQYP